MGDLNLNLVWGLMIFMSSNIVLGSVKSIFDGTFDLRRFWVGFGKASVIALSFTAMVFAGSLNPDVISFQLGDETVNFVQGVNLIILSAYVAYGAQSLAKLKDYVLPKEVKLDE